MSTPHPQDSQLAAFRAVGPDTRVRFLDFKNNIMEHLTNNFLHDFDDVNKHIQKQAPDHISEGYVLGRSLVIYLFSKPYN